MITYGFHADHVVFQIILNIKKIRAAHVGPVNRGPMPWHNWHTS